MIGRKGDERVLSVYWFVIFVIIAAAVVGGVLLFFSNPLDVREVESSLLSDKVIDCFVDKGVLSVKLKEGADIEEVCGLNFKDINDEDVEKNQYFVEVVSNGLNVSTGNVNLKIFCVDEERKENAPVCSIKKIVVLNDKNELVGFEVLSAVLKEGQNA